jgi:hypothetical protein
VAARRPADAALRALGFLPQHDRQRGELLAPGAVGAVERNSGTQGSRLERLFMPQSGHSLVRTRTAQSVKGFGRRPSVRAERSPRAGIRNPSPLRSFDLSDLSAVALDGAAVSERRLGDPWLTIAADRGRLIACRVSKLGMCQSGCLVMGDA